MYGVLHGASEPLQTLLVNFPPWICVVRAFVSSTNWFNDKGHGFGSVKVCLQQAILCQNHSHIEKKFDIWNGKMWALKKLAPESDKAHRRWKCQSCFCRILRHFDFRRVSCSFFTYFCKLLQILQIWPITVCWKCNCWFACFGHCKAEMLSRCRCAFVIGM